MSCYSLLQCFSVDIPGVLLHPIQEWSDKVDDMNFAELLRGFFRFYATEFEWGLETRFSVKHPVAQGAVLDAFGQTAKGGPKNVSLAMI